MNNCKLWSINDMHTIESSDNKHFPLIAVNTENFNLACCNFLIYIVNVLPVHQTECFYSFYGNYTVLRKLVNLDDLSSTSLLCDRLKESILECYMVKYYCEKLFGECEESIQVSVLESIPELFLTIRGYAITRVQRNKIV